MPQSLSADNNAFTTFIKVMSLPSGKRQKTFSEISNDEKASVFKVQMALQFLKRPNLTKEQKDLMLEALTKISADTYDKENSERATEAKKDADELQEKALAIFAPNEAYEIFGSLNGDKTADIAFLRKYEQTISFPMRERKKIIRAAAPSEKSDFWKTQLIYHLATARLSENQFLFITEVFPLMTSSAFNFPSIEGQNKNEDTKALEEFTSKASELFSDDEVFTIFMGYETHKNVFVNTREDNNKIKTAELEAKNKTVSVNTLEGDVAPIEVVGRKCDCNYMCGWGETCTTTSCGISTDGCGFFGGSECHSYCMTNY